MGLMGNIMKANLMNSGTISGSAWPFAAFVTYQKGDGKDGDYLEVTKPDNTTEKITHDMIQCATVLAM
ncbi:MAG: hypothetical protein IKC37_01655, partial [Clostridia bacterium]|nr:hypothetical protein [Clostridia bacterium]